MIAFIKARIWTGGGWLLTLCLTLTILTVIYLLLHNCHKGTDHKRLDNQQLTNIDNILSGFPETNVDSTTDTAKKNKLTQTLRMKRNAALSSFLTTEYNNSVDTTNLKQLNAFLMNLNSKDTRSYLTNKDIIVTDFFWFQGTGAYAEVIWWALAGVLVSLIYYVSVANGQSIKQAGNADTGPFDVSEISLQVAKMFYAPLCTLVLVLGYNLLNADNKLTDISIGKGLLLFSFICGFFSGRVMKFLDKLKDLVLPLSSNDDTSNTNTANSKTDVDVKLQLAPPIAQSADGPDIAEGGFNKAIVTLKPQSGGDIITLAQPTADQDGGFTGSQVPFGKYSLTAAMAFKKQDGSLINLAAAQDIEISETSKSFTVALDKAASDG